MVSREPSSLYEVAVYQRWLFFVVQHQAPKIVSLYQLMVGIIHADSPRVFVRQMKSESLSHSSLYQFEVEGVSEYLEMRVLDRRLRFFWKYLILVKRMRNYFK